MLVRALPFTSHVCFPPAALLGMLIDGDAGEGLKSAEDRERPLLRNSISTKRRCGRGSRIQELPVAPRVILRRTPGW